MEFGYDELLPYSDIWINRSRFIPSENSNFDIETGNKLTKDKNLFKFDEIVANLMQNYDGVDEETASELIAKIRSELELSRGVNRRRDLMIKINPGFKTTVVLNPISSEITITVSGINDIYYLNTIV